MGLIRQLYYRYFSEERDLVQRLHALLGFIPDNLYVYKTAFLHKSLLNETNERPESNERLEYLGDAILNSVVAEYLYKKYPSRDEGFLTKMRSKIVKRRTLNSVALNMELDIYLKEYNNTKLSESMLGNALEALIGAVYIDTGYKRTKFFVIQKVLKIYLDLNTLENLDDNYKSRLLEYCQKTNRAIEYVVIEKFKQNNRDRFKIELLVDGQVVSSAEDYNKKGAEQKASKKAISLLNTLV